MQDCQPLIMELFKTYKQSVANLGTAVCETRPRNIAFNYIVGD